MGEMADFALDELSDWDEEYYRQCMEQGTVDPIDEEGNVIEDPFTEKRP
jgi:hypothetical protein